MVDKIIRSGQPGGSGGGGHGGSGNPTSVVGKYTFCCPQEVMVEMVGRTGSTNEGLLVAVELQLQVQMGLTLNPRHRWRWWSRSCIKY